MRSFVHSVVTVYLGLGAQAIVEIVAREILVPILVAR